jgi:hypothetical protein
LNPLGPIYSVAFVVALVCAAAFYKAAEVEDRPPLVWAGLSAFVFYITWQILHWGLLGDLFGQGLLLAGITLMRVYRDYRKTQ